MSYQQAVEKLYALGHELASTPPHKFDLDNMRVLMANMGYPQDRYASVMVAGTNGKGSTAATLASILQTAGHRTGLYTSPHLVKINERIQVDGVAIDDEDFAEMHQRVEAISERLLLSRQLPWAPSFFEMLTAMALEYFAQQRIKIAVLEVGMGGRLDATNVVEPILTVITDISLDHQKYLGDTVGQIAFEKASIIRKRSTVVTLPQHPEANDVIGKMVLERKARAVSAVPYVPPVSPGADTFPADAPSAAGGETGLRMRYPLTVMGKQIQVDSPLAGRHQLRNLALAIAAAEELAQSGFQLSVEDVERGIRETRWPGRFQVMPPTSQWPEMVLDAAHNPAGAWALRSALSAHYEGRPLVMVFGAVRDKAIAEMAQILFPLAEQVVLTHAENPRSATVEELCQLTASAGAGTTGATTVSEALEEARRLAAALPQAAVAVTGSIYLVGETLGLLAKESAAVARH